MTLTAGEQVTPAALLLDASPAPTPASLLGQAVRRPTLDELTAEYVPLVLREVGGARPRPRRSWGIGKRSLYRWEKQLAASDTLSPEATS